MEKKYIYLWEFFVSTVGHVFISHTFVEWVFYEVKQKIMYIFTPYATSGSTPSPSLPPSDRDMHIMYIALAAMLINLLVVIIICLIEYKGWKEKIKTVICTILSFLAGIPLSIVILYIGDAIFR